MVLSDRSIRRLLEAGRIGIDPYDESLLQPSSVDVRVDRYFRVFRNSRYPFINVKEAQEDLTEKTQLVVFLGRGKNPDVRPAKLVAEDRFHDLALLEIEGALAGSLI